MYHHIRLLVIAFLVLLGFAWALRSTPAPAAPNPAITPLFLGSLSGSATAATGPADTLFSALAGSASSSIDIAMYDFNRATVRDALIAAHGRGVTVRVVADGADAADPGYAPYYTGLLADGITVITDTKSSLMHNKFAVFDKHVTWTGSVNFSNTGFTLNGENAIVITDTVVADIFATEFAEMFSGKFSNDKTDNTAHAATVGGSQLEIAFAPTDGVQNRIVNALNTANSSIQIAMFTFTNDALGDALIAAHSRGVQVEVLLDQSEAGVAGGERDRLCAGGVTVRVENFAGKIHDKYAVVDTGAASDPLIVTGSTNWTANAVTANDENMLIIHDTGLASAYAADFARLRSAITPGGFACNVGSPLTPTAVQYLPVVQRADDGAALTATADALTATAAAEPTSMPTPTPTATPTPTITPTPTGSATITFILYDPPDTLSEYVQIQNTSGAALDMTGWTLRDLANNTYTFPTFTLAAGATVKVWTNSGTNDSANLYWGRSQAVWNNTGDTAFLRNAQGELVDQYSY
jgi:phosphatidylserine/phosphatidylglycerophosphate/cardiolipin synthase-like enzyme